MSASVRKRKEQQQHWKRRRQLEVLIFKTKKQKKIEAF